MASCSVHPRTPNVAHMATTPAASARARRRRPTSAKLTADPSEAPGAETGEEHAHCGIVATEHVDGDRGGADIERAGDPRRRRDRPVSVRTCGSPTRSRSPAVNSTIADSRAGSSAWRPPNPDDAGARPIVLSDPRAISAPIHTSTAPGEATERMAPASSGPTSRPAVSTTPVAVLAAVSSSAVVAAVGMIAAIVGPPNVSRIENVTASPYTITIGCVVQHRDPGADARRGDEPVADGEHDVAAGTRRSPRRRAVPGSPPG